MKRKLDQFEQELIELCKKHDIVIKSYIDPCYCEDIMCDCRTTNYYFNRKKDKSGNLGTSIEHLKYELEKDL